jgi:hypothetical protein
MRQGAAGPLALLAAALAASILFFGLESLPGPSQTFFPAPGHAKLAVLAFMSGLFAFPLSLVLAVLGRKRAGMMCFAFATVVLNGFIVSVFLEGAARRRVVERAAPLVASLERVKAEKRRYPESLEAGVAPEAGSLGAGPYLYRREGDEYQLSVDVNFGETMYYRPSGAYPFAHAKDRKEGGWLIYNYSRSGKKWSKTRQRPS